VQPDAAAAPVIGFDERVELHEFIDDFLRLILRDGAPPVDLALFFCRFDNFWIRGKRKEWRRTE
jgi:hypothetical protein